MTTDEHRQMADKMRRLVELFIELMVYSYDAAARSPLASADSGDLSRCIRRDLGQSQRYFYQALAHVFSTTMGVADSLDAIADMNNRFEAQEYMRQMLDRRSILEATVREALRPIKEMVNPEAEG